MGTLEGGSSKIRADVAAGGLVKVKSFSQTFEQRATQTGDAYNLNTGVLNINNATAGAALSYIKNNEKETLIITAFIYLLGNSTDGTGDAMVTVIENPTGGTILSSTVGVPKNRNLGSKKIIDVDWRIGAVGKTVSGGTTAIDSLYASPVGRKPVAVVTSLPTGASLCVTYDPQTANSSQNVMIAMACYLDTIGI